MLAISRCADCFIYRGNFVGICTQFIAFHAEMLPRNPGIYKCKLVCASYRLHHMLIQMVTLCEGVTHATYSFHAENLFCNPIIIL